MSKEQIISRHAINLKSLVGTGLAQDECNEIIRYAINEALTLYGVGSSLCIDDEVADVLVEKIYKENKEDLQYLTDKEGLFKAGLAHGLLSKIRLHE